MNKKPQELIELSIIDKDIDSYTPQLELLDKKIARSEAKIDAAKEEIAAIKVGIDDNVSKISSFNTQIADLSEQLKTSDKKSKDISTEKEMKALSLEDDIAKEKISFANEEINRLSDINSVKITTLEELNDGLAKLEVKQEEVNSEVISQKEAIEKSKSELFAARETKSMNIDQKILSFYEKIRIWAGNTAVVPVKKQACYGCYIKINDKTYSDVIKSSEIVTCPHCGRILYIENDAIEA